MRKRFSDVRKEHGSFDRYIWDSSEGKPLKSSRRKGCARAVRRTPESDTMSKALKKRGFRFVGSTICYAFMQATGMVNDHALDCFLHEMRGV